MARTIGIGIQDFGKIIKNNCFYVDKTDFIREWWESMDDVTMITRPRRFGKTLNMSMLEHFFSLKYSGERALFERLSIWKQEKYRELQGSFPVISLSFANVKEKDYTAAKARICQIITNLYSEFYFLRDQETLTEKDREYFDRVSPDMREVDATYALHQLSEYLYRFYGKKVIILLDEYDTPMQEAYINGYWDELAAFMRSLFNSTFKTNPCMERAVMTGITRISKESIFSDLNNLEVVTAVSDKYADTFGFTEREVAAALKECGLDSELEKVRYWYDGFTFGKHRDIYNPWSILNYLSTRKLNIYWANTSSNSLVGKLIREGSRSIKEKFETLLRGESLQAVIDEQIVYSQLDSSENAVWSLFLAGGYLKIAAYEEPGEEKEWALPCYQLALTNFEVKLMFRNMVHEWFSPARADYNDFVKALLLGDVNAMNVYMNRVSLQTFSYFDAGGGNPCAEPERFYHGFVLGLLVDLQGDYVISSNRESGFGRYDVMLEPRDPRKCDAVILEFKVQNTKTEAGLSETVQASLKQIEEKRYEAQLTARGLPKERIRKYGFAFSGKQVLIG